MSTRERMRASGHAPRRTLAVLLAWAVVAASLVFASPAAAVGGPVLSGFVPVAPARLLDTRPGGTTIDAFGSGSGAVGASASTTVRVAGRGGVPSAGVGAVALNVTSVDATHDTYVSVFAAGTPRPASSNLNPSAGGAPTPNMVVVPLSAEGDVELYNAAGSVQLVVDVAGWFPVGSAYTPVTPRRLLDTRNPTASWDGQPGGQVVGGATFDLRVTGTADVPSSGVGAVLLNVTAVDATLPSFVTVFAHDGQRPVASSSNPAPGRVTPALVAAPVGSDGKVSLYNSAGATHLVVDVVGWIAAGAPYVPLIPARLLDTRAGEPTVDERAAGGGRVGGASVDHKAINLHVAGRAGIPVGVETVVINVTAVNATAPSYVTVWPAGTDRPWASNLNTVPGLISTNLVVARVSAAGDIALFNSAGMVDLIVDVVGYFMAPASTDPPDPDPGPGPDPVATPLDNIWLDSTSAPIEQDVPSPTPTYVLPTPGVATVTAATGLTQAGTLPVFVRSDDPAAVPFGVRVEVLSQAAADAAGAEVLLVQITPTVVPAHDVALSVELDYSAFADRFGGDWADRLGVVAFDGCAVSAPGPDCDGDEWVPSVVDHERDR
ncbi:MAG TPA: hypothetical protein PLV68_13330, partial [Ilumatobacteraceae bacterium]|nr:hypothetical protein [Ilumatobacteraceae bacterium]